MGVSIDDGMRGGPNRKETRMTLAEFAALCGRRKVFYKGTDAPVSEVYEQLERLIAAQVDQHAALEARVRQLEQQQGLTPYTDPLGH